MLVMFSNRKDHFWHVHRKSVFSDFFFSDDQAIKIEQNMWKAHQKKVIILNNLLDVLEKNMQIFALLNPNPNHH